MWPWWWWWEQQWWRWLPEGVEVVQVVWAAAVAEAWAAGLGVAAVAEQVAAVAEQVVAVMAGGALAVAVGVAVCRGTVGSGLSIVLGVAAA